MSEEILINVTPRETRVAVVENGMLQEVLIERARRRGLVGNIYKGKVLRVMPGMQAAFVDVGLSRSAFLHASDIHRGLPELLPTEAEAAVQPPPTTPPIGELVRDGQEVVVQIIKDPIGSKGARLSMHLSIPARFLVLLPDSRVTGVSVRIEDEAERGRLKQLLAELAALPPAGGHFGFIARTNAEGTSRELLEQEIGYLVRLWEVVQQRARQAKVGEPIYEDVPLALRTLRDFVRAPVERIRIDSRETLDKAVRFAEEFVPETRPKIEHYPGERPIFDLYGVEDEIQRALQKQVPLKSGGHLVIDQTEAMTTIDVNTGGYVGHRNLEETVYRTNLEAAQVIARQLRLRNLGGIIIIDFIDMVDEEHRRQVLRTLEKALARDHARTTVYPMSPLGLVEMTRKRTTESLERLLCEPCKVCEGRGVVKSVETVVYEVFREITRSVRQFETGGLLVLASPAVVNRIIDEESAALAELEAFVARTLRFQAEEQYAPEQYDVIVL